MKKGSLTAIVVALVSHIAVFALSANASLAQSTFTDEGITLALSGGLASVGRDMGLHAGLALRQPLGSRAAVRLESIVSEGIARGLSTLGTLQVFAAKNWYGLGGAGTSYDNGVQGSWTVGLGRAISAADRRFALEVRYLSTNGGALFWSFAHDLW